MHGTARTLSLHSLTAGWTITGMGALRCVLVMTQTAGILTTWPLWQARVTPPMLPVISGLELNMGPVLLASLGCVLVRPLWGAWLHVACLLWAMLLDQMRLQPEFISQALLLLGTSGGYGLRTIARTHLIALWFFAGFYKLTCPGYLTGDARWLVHAFVPSAPQSLVVLIGVAIALGEIALASCAACVATRRVAAAAGYVLHLGIVLVLAFGLQWDVAVWPWNLALAMSALVLIGGWDESIRETWGTSNPLTRLGILTLLLLPWGYLFGFVDTYLCHVLYSNHAPVAVIHQSETGSTQIVDTRPQLNVPVPQIARLYRAHFAAVGQPGDRLEILDPRLWFRLRGRDRTVIDYEAAVRRGY